MLVKIRIQISRKYVSVENLNVERTTFSILFNEILGLNGILAFFHGVKNRESDELVDVNDDMLKKLFCKRNVIEIKLFSSEFKFSVLEHN